MIFVTVGTHFQGFDRLIKKMDEIAPEINEEIIMQIGPTDYEPKNTRWFKFSSYEATLNLIKKSDIVICHGGAGTLLDCLGFNKKILIVPRLGELEESCDGHEFELATAIKDKNISIVHDIDYLKDHILKSQEKLKKILFIKKDSQLVNFIKDYLNGEFQI